MYTKLQLLPEKSFVLGELNQLVNILSPANCKGCKIDEWFDQAGSDFSKTHSLVRDHINS